jgi:hypothetical protein
MMKGVACIDAVCAKHALKRLHLPPLVAADGAAMHREHLYGSSKIVTSGTSPSIRRQPHLGQSANDRSGVIDAHVEQRTVRDHASSAREVHTVTHEGAAKVGDARVEREDMIKGSVAIGACTSATDAPA